MDSILQLRTGIKMVSRARKVRKRGFRPYHGTIEEICSYILKDSYDGFFRVSSGHFTQFWCRDFAFVCEALIKLGYENEVRSTLEFVMESFIAAGRIGQVVTVKREVMDFPCYGPDTLALFIYSCIRTGNGNILRNHKEFVQAETDRFVREVMDSRTGLPVRGKRFSSIRDHVSRDASCYDMTMIALMAHEARKLGLRFPITPDQARRRLIDNYWNGTYFFADLGKQRIVTGDANVFPFWTGVVKDVDMLEQALTSIQAAGLDDPHPLRYVSTQDSRREKNKMHWTSMLAKDYETDSIWTHLGLCYIRILMQKNRGEAKGHIEAFTESLKKNHTFLEVYDREGKPFQRALYVTDEAMSWCAPYLVMARELEVVN